MNIDELCIRCTVQIRGGRRQNKRVVPGTTLNRVCADKSIDRVVARTRIDPISA